jgi:hypothetical protein
MTGWAKTTNGWPNENIVSGFDVLVTGQPELSSNNSSLEWFPTRAIRSVTRVPPGILTFNCEASQDNFPSHSREIFWLRRRTMMIHFLRDWSTRKQVPSWRFCVSFWLHANFINKTPVWDTVEDALVLSTTWISIARLGSKLVKQAERLIIFQCVCRVQLLSDRNISFSC